MEEEEEEQDHRRIASLLRVSNNNLDHILQYHYHAAASISQLFHPSMQIPTTTYLLLWKPTIVFLPSQR
jgi:hypothetical protein